MSRNNELDPKKLTEEMIEADKIKDHGTYGVLKNTTYSNGSSSTEPIHSKIPFEQAANVNISYDEFGNETMLVLDPED